MLQKTKFRHYHIGTNVNAHEDDGSTMIRIIFDKCDPTTKLGINTLKTKLVIFELEDYDQNAAGILDSMQLCHNQIIHSEGQSDDFMLKTFFVIKDLNTCKWDFN